MQTNLISMVILATVPVPGGEGGGDIGERKMFYQKCSQYVLGWFGDQTNSASGHPKVGGGRSRDWDTIAICSFF